MDRAEAEAMYDSGREACVEFILELAGRVKQHEERLRRLEEQGRQDSRTSSKPPSQGSAQNARAAACGGAGEGEGVDARRG
jgi:transposase